MSRRAQANVANPTARGARCGVLTASDHDRAAHRQLPDDLDERRPACFALVGEVDKTASPAGKVGHDFADFGEGTGDLDDAEHVQRLTLLRVPVGLVHVADAERLPHAPPVISMMLSNITENQVVGRQASPSADCRQRGGVSTWRRILSWRTCERSACG